MLLKNSCKMKGGFRDSKSILRAEAVGGTQIGTVNASIYKDVPAGTGSLQLPYSSAGDLVWSQKFDGSQFSALRDYGIGDQGFADGQDFLVWQRNPSIGSVANWQANYGTPVPLSESSAAVPELEPSTWMILALAAIICDKLARWEIALARRKRMPLRIIRIALPGLLFFLTSLAKVDN